MCSNGNDGMGGLKFSSWEGGTRIPYMVRLPGRITPNSVSDHMLTNYDLMPTLADFIGAEIPQDKDGVSFLPTLLERHEDPAAPRVGAYMPHDSVRHS